MPVYLPPINRRKFIKSTSIATAGVLLGFKGDLFGNVSNVDPDYFVLVADTHIDEDRSTEVGAGLAERFEIVVNRVLDNTASRPAGVIVNGDVARTRGLPGDYLEFFNIVKPLREAGIPIYVTMGNHDDRDSLWETLPDEKPDEDYVSDKHVLIVESPNAYHFLLDTLYIVNGRPGLLEEEQLDWLARTLPDYDDKPVILYGHHHPVSRGTLSTLEDYDKLWEIIRPMRHVKAYIYGHTHAWRIENLAGLHGINLPATAGGAGTSPVGFVHSEFKSDRVNLRLEALDTGHPWHDQQGSLVYRSDEPTSADGQEEIPGAMQLHQNYPNPFNPKTTIRYEISSGGHVNLTVFDTQGRRIASLVNENQSAGQHEVVFDAGSLASGIYVYKLEKGSSTIVKSMTLVK